VIADPPLSVSGFNISPGGRYSPDGFDTFKQYQISSYTSLPEMIFLERCLTMLKPGGRMGIVLSEKVLSDSKFQKARAFIESRAKILSIMALPKGIASQTLVKTNLVFLRKFTDVEKENYTRIKKEVTNKISSEYDAELNEINTRINSRGISKDERKELRSKHKQLLQEIEDAVYSGIKDKFDYSILISVLTFDRSPFDNFMPIEQQMSEVEKIFKEHRIKNHLWTERRDDVRYDIFNDVFQRVTAVGEPEIFYGKDFGDI